MQRNAFKIDTHIHISQRTDLGEFTIQKSNPFSLLPDFKHQNQTLDITLVDVFFISFLYVSFETLIIKDFPQYSLESHENRPRNPIL